MEQRLNEAEQRLTNSKGMQIIDNTGWWYPNEPNGTSKIFGFRVVKETKFGYLELLNRETGDAISGSGIYKMLGIKDTETYGSGNETVLPLPIGDFIFPDGYTIGWFQMLERSGIILLGGTAFED